MAGAETTRAAAFFDLDKTLIEGSSAVHFARAAYKAGMRTRREIAGDLWANLKFRYRGSTDEETDALRHAVLDALAGQRVTDLKRLGPAVLAGVLPLVYDDVLQEAWGHIDAGRPVYIVTAASQELAAIMAEVLVLDGGIGVRSESRDGVYTGKAEGPFTYREGKVEAIKDLADEAGFDLAESYAYSDSESDLPMLRAVGHPVVVNPDAELARIAKVEGWRIMRFDKLARRLKILGAVAALALAGGGGGYVAGRLRDPAGRARRLASGAIRR